MRHVPETSRPSPRLPEDQLNSWKEIAAYLGRDVTTVQRWERREGMPVHRLMHDKVGSVYAFRSELDAWTQSRNPKLEQESATPALPGPAVGPEVAAKPPPHVQPSFPRWVLLIALAVAAFAAGASLLLRNMDGSWRNPIEGARFQAITDFDGVARDAVLSREGQLVAFLSDHDGQMDVWVTQIGSGQFHNLTRGSEADIANPLIRPLGFSPDSSLVTFWARKPGGSNGQGISIWAVPTLGGQPRLYLEGAAEFDWSHDGSRVAYHNSGPGDPLFVSDGLNPSAAKPVFTATPGLHSHFPMWSPNGIFVYFVLGTLPDKLDVWRIASQGGAPERVTSHFSRVSYPVLLNARTLIYLAGDSDGSGPWLWGMDLARRQPNRLTSGPERYTSLSASADGKRVAATLATLKRTLWHLPVTDSKMNTSAPAPVRLTTSAGLFPHFGPGYLLYVSTAGGSDTLWKLANGVETELWKGQGLRILAPPVISADGQQIALTVRQDGRSRLYVMRTDGTRARVVRDSQALEGTPAWAPDGRSIVSAVNSHGNPHLFRLPTDGGSPVPLLNEYSVDPVWAPGGRFFLYSGADIGTTFSLKAANADGTSHAVPAVTLTRGARHVVFAPGGRRLVFLRGEITHKDLWSIDLQTGAERQLTKLPADFDVSEFDLSPDGTEVVLERIQERSDILLLDLAHQ